MGRAHLRGSVACLLLSVPVAAAQPGPTPGQALPSGQRVEVKDGDTILVRGDARVRVIRRSEAIVRAIYNGEQRSLILLADYVDPHTGVPDGFVDSTYHIEDLDGAWPFGERWEGSATLDDYGSVFGPTAGLALSADGAYVQLFQGSPASNAVAASYVDSRALQVTYRGIGHTTSPLGSPNHLTFAEAEARALAEAARNPQNRARGSSMTAFSSEGGGAGVASLGVAGSDAGRGRSGEAPVRVGSRILTPRKIFDVPAVLPPLAARANVRGMVVLEIVVGADGRVTDARVLRSIPLLDQAALDAVRQWRYEPTQINDRLVPVVMTVTVTFQ